MSAWRKGSTSGNGGCFELQRDLTGDILIRNSNRPGEWISDTNEAFRVFVDCAKAGEFDYLLDGADVLRVTRVDLQRENARLRDEVEQLRATLRHPAGRKGRISAALTRALEE